MKQTLTGRLLKREQTVPGSARVNEDLAPAGLVEAALARLGEGSCDSVRVRRCGQWHEGESGCLVKPL